MTVKTDTQTMFNTLFEIHRLILVHILINEGRTLLAQSYKPQNPIAHKHYK